jgi:hypothetical protein
MHRNELEARINERASKDEGFKKELLADPKAVVERELGSKLAADLKVKVVIETDDTAYLVLRAQLPKSKELDEAQLDAVAGGRTTHLTPNLGKPVLSGHQYGVTQADTSVPGGRTTRGQ